MKHDQEKLIQYLISQGHSRPAAEHKVSKDAESIQKEMAGGKSNGDDEEEEEEEKKPPAPPTKPRPGPARYKRR